jgi:2-amino-4-hydroxy-6-hydroxymethyldihydropteridine diphosphokinase
MKEIFILLGSNRGDRMDYMARAMQMISTNVGAVLKKSAVYETEPWGFKDSTPFLNQVIEIETNLSPAELLEQLLTIEARLGRIRPFGGCGCSTSANQQAETAYAGRTIDLDILFYGNKLVFTDDLMIPHPRLHERRFSLIPLNEMVPDLIHPLLKKKISQLLLECHDKTKVDLSP